MTVRITISVPDEVGEQIETLVKAGGYASSSELLRYGLKLVERELAEERRKEEEHQARLDAIRADLEERRKGPFITMEEGDKLIAEHRARRDAERTRKAS